MTVGSSTSKDIKVLVSDNAPPFPIAGPAVAKELDMVCPINVLGDGTQVSSCPAIDEYFSRVQKYKKQVEVKP